LPYFTRGLDFDEYVGDMEVRDALAFVQQRVFEKERAAAAAARRQAIEFEEVDEEYEEIDENGEMQTYTRRVLVPR
jgi:hypothetical protein